MTVSKFNSIKKGVAYDESNLSCQKNLTHPDQKDILKLN